MCRCASPTRRPGPFPLPLSQHSPEPRRTRRLNRSPRSWGSLTVLQQCEQWMRLATTSGISKRKPVPKPNVAAWLLAAGIALASPSFLLSSADGREGTGCGLGVRLSQSRGPLNLSVGTIEILRGTEKENENYHPGCFGDLRTDRYSLYQRGTASCGHTYSIPTDG